MLRAHCVVEVSGQKYAVPTKDFLDGLWKCLHLQPEPELLTDVQRLKWEQANLPPEPFASRRKTTPVLFCGGVLLAWHGQISGTSHISGTGHPAPTRPLRPPSQKQQLQLWRLLQRQSRTLRT